MTGFTLYETLRILVPGAISVLLVDVLVRLALPATAVAASRLVSGIEGPAVYVGASVIAGLILYQFDVPQKTRIAREGDPERGLRIPSEALKKHLSFVKDTNSLRTYFLLSDRYLSTETHKRVYLFGSLYRIFVDMRILLGIAIAIGPFTSLVYAKHHRVSTRLQTSKTAAIPWLLMIFLFLFIVAGYGFDHYRRNVKAKRPDDLKAFGKRLVQELREIWLTSLVIAGAGFVALYLLLNHSLLFAVPAAVLTLLAYLLWIFLEMGPPSRPQFVGPNVASEQTSTALRTTVLESLGAEHEGPQYSPIQRLLADSALATPWLVAVIFADSWLARPPSYLLAWGLLVLVCSALVSFRKHEERLLSVYEEQSLWLDLHAADLKRIDQTRNLPDEWN